MKDLNIAATEINIAAMENTGTIEKAVSLETFPANWDDFFDILKAYGNNKITEKEMKTRTSLFSNEEKLWQFFLNTL